MKKLFLLLLITFAAFSCSKEEESLDTLVGTIWSTDQSETEYMILTFSESTVKFELFYNGKEMDEEWYNYTYDHPNLIIDGDNLVISDNTIRAGELVYIKQ